MKNQVFLLFSEQSNFNLICQRIETSNYQIQTWNSQFVMKEICPFGTWKKAVKNVTFDSKLSQSRGIHCSYALCLLGLPLLYIKLSVGI